MDKISFKFNAKKAIEAILWLVSKEESGVDIYRILKAGNYKGNFTLFC